MTTNIQTLQLLDRLPLERILAIGITGSGKSYQWLKIAQRLKPLGIKFRVIDTDNDIDFMLHTQFPMCLPENGGNVYVCPAFDWKEYELSTKWVQQKDLTPEELGSLDKYLQVAYKLPMKHHDWVIADKANNAWARVQSHFTTEVFGSDMGEYFLGIRKKLYEAGDIGKSGKKASSVALEALDGWKDWAVINKLYDDWINPIVYRIHCNVYAAADVETISTSEKDPEVLNIFGKYKVKPAGNKKLGGQMHSIMLYLPGSTDGSYFATTLKDRSGRQYFTKVPLVDFYTQYLFAKAGWPMVDLEE